MTAKQPQYRQWFGKWLVNFTQLEILAMDQKQAGDRSEPWERIYIIRAFETWTLVNQSQQYPLLLIITDINYYMSRLV